MEERLSLSVVGTSVQAVLVAAAAAARSGERVRLVGAGVEGRTLNGRGLGLDGTVVLEADVAPALDGPIVVAAASAADVLELARSLGPAAAERDVVLIPGGAGAALAIGGEADAPTNRLFELPGFPYLGSIAGDEVTFHSRKDHLPIGGEDPVATARTAAALNPYLPGLEPGPRLATSLANTNNIVHPAIALANLSRIDRGDDFRFYREGLSSAAIGLVLAVDRERLRLTDAVGLPRISVEDWFGLFYGAQGFATSGLLDGLATFEPLADSAAPRTVDHRYLVDDVRYGIAVYEAIGGLLGVSTPAVTAVVTALSIATGADLRDRAPALAGLLLASERSLMAASASTPSTG